MSLNRQFGYVFGGVYVLVGLIGFAITSGVGFAATQGKNLIILELNPLHNIVHIAVGGLLIAGAKLGASRVINSVVGSVYLLVGLVGLAIVDSPLNHLAINHPDNVLHLATAVLALSLGLGGDRLISQPETVSAGTGN